MADNPAINQPDSGTYGETADLNSLKASLPQGAVGMPAPPMPQPPPVQPGSTRPPSSTQGRPSTGAAAPPGIPSAVLSPTHLPLPTAPQPLNPLAGAQTPSQGRLALLQMLASSPGVSATTRAWALEVTHLLLGGTPQTLQAPANVGPQ